MQSVDDVVAQEERCLSRERAESSRMGLGGNRGDKNDFGSYNDSASLIDDDERQQQEQMYAQDVSSIACVLVSSFIMSYMFSFSVSIFIIYAHSPCHLLSMGEGQP